MQRFAWTTDWRPVYFLTLAAPRRCEPYRGPRIGNGASERLSCRATKHQKNETDKRVVEAVARARQARDWEFVRVTERDDAEAFAFPHPA